MALIFYTDFSKLCTAFSASFRKIHSFETLASIKERNALYFWMSKALRELVELFGRCSYGDTFDDDYEPLDASHGPFYCGMNCVLNIGSLELSLKGPCSTTSVRAVAMNFAKEQGMILKLNCLMKTKIE